MKFDQLLNGLKEVECEIASGPIVPPVTPSEIRDYLASRYDFTRPLAVEDISDDVQRMLRKWQVHVTHPRYLGLFNPSVTQASVVGDTLTSVRLAS